VTNNYIAVNGLTKLGFKKEKFCVIHNAYDLTQVPIIRQQKKDVVNIISVARFVTQKDYFTALRAVSLLKKRLANDIIVFKFYLIGFGELENQIRTWVKELNIDDLVEIIIKPNNLSDYFKDADIFLTTSVFEGLSNSVMEAMSFSLPVVATKAGDMEYLVKEDINGYLCDIGNVEKISNSLYKLVCDDQLRNTMGSNGYDLLKMEFNIDIFTEKYVNFINSL
jgi:glycosyltransferase involved in cell wall biosynthesis